MPLDTNHLGVFHRGKKRWRDNPALMRLLMEL
jgi:hypothetical protein